MNVSLIRPAVPRPILILEMAGECALRTRGTVCVHSIHCPDVQVQRRRSEEFLLRCLAMSEIALGSPASRENAAPAAMEDREAGLQRNLTPAQLAMLGLGSTIGTGLFLGSAISVKLAGPAVILSFAAAAFIALPMMWALAEMAAAHPAAGSFGLFAEMYLHPWAGFAIRLTYWLCMMVVVGSEVVAASIYCKLWFPNMPPWVWISLFSFLVLYVNTMRIQNLGIVEFLLSTTKVVIIFI